MKGKNTEKTKRKTHHRPKQGYSLQFLRFRTAFRSAVDSRDTEPLSSAQNVAISVSVVDVTKEALHESRPF